MNLCGESSIEEPYNKKCTGVAGRAESEFNATGRNLVVLVVYAAKEVVVKVRIEGVADIHNNERTERVTDPKVLKKLDGYQYG